MENLFLYLAMIIVLPLAVWRVARMLASYDERGPADILTRLRILAGVRYDEFSNPTTIPGSFADGLVCVYCNSVWIGAAFMILLVVSPHAAFYIGLPFALSAAAILLERITSQ